MAARAAARGGVRAVRRPCRPAGPRATPRGEIAWEANLDGAGLWITHPGGEVEEIVAPAPYVEHYVKPAGWRFAEYAYAAWLTHHRADDEGEFGKRDR